MKKKKKKWMMIKTIGVPKTWVSVNTTSAHRPHRRPVFVDCHSRWLGIDRQYTRSLHRNDMAYGHFELRRDCGLGC